MIWKNHFFKKKIHNWTTLPSSSHSIVLNAIPDGELVSLFTLINNVHGNKDNEDVKTDKQIKDLLSELIKGKFVGELVSEKIYRAIKDI